MSILLKDMGELRISPRASQAALGHFKRVFRGKADVDAHGIRPGCGNHAKAGMVKRADAGVITFIPAAWD